MTAEERLELAIRTMTRVRDSQMRLYNLNMEQGLLDKADRNMDEVLIWDQALMMLTGDQFLVDVARIYGEEVSEQ